MKNDKTDFLKTPYMVPRAESLAVDSNGLLCASSVASKNAGTESMQMQDIDIFLP